MHHAYFVFRKDFLQTVVSGFKVFQVALLALLNHGEHDVHLAALVYLLAYAVVERCELIVEFVNGLYGLSTRWQFVDYAHIQVAVNGHGQCAGNGRGCHYKNVRRVHALCPQFGSLCHAKAMLFVDYSQAQVRKFHVILDQCVSAHKNLDVARYEFLQNALPAFAFHHTCEQFYLNRHVLQKAAQCLQMLFGQNFGGCHHASLKTIVDGYQHRHECHQRLARAHVALQQAVHLPA